MMMKNTYKGKERRKFLRLDYVTTFDYKICKKKTISKLFKGYTRNISKGGLLYNIKDKVKEGDILWLSIEKDMLSICEEIDKRCLIYQNGIIGKVVWIEHKKDHSHNVGIQFLTREEKSSTHIYPEIYFSKHKIKTGEQSRNEEELEQEEEVKEEESENKDYLEDEIGEDQDL